VHWQYVAISHESAASGDGIWELFHCGFGQVRPLQGGARPEDEDEHCAPFRVAGYSGPDLKFCTCGLSSHCAEMFPGNSADAELSFSDPDVFFLGRAGLIPRH
jgi:hypothetical protein